MTDTIIEYYTAYDERSRLTNIHTLEFIRSQEIISRYLSSGKIKILDIGGAAGIYSFWLASLGNTVDLIDLTPKHIEQAMEYQKRSNITLSSIKIGNACELPYENEIYDMVLLMGPMYHIQNIDQRIKALLEAKRVMKRNGIILVAAISKYASMIDGYLNDAVNDNTFYQIMEEDIGSGMHVNKTKDPRYFTNSYFHHADELKIELERAGLKCKNVISVEGFGICIPEVEMKIKNEEYKMKLFNVLRKIEDDPTIIGISPHYLAIGEKE